MGLAVFVYPRTLCVSPQPPPAFTLHSVPSLRCTLFLIATAQPPPPRSTSFCHQASNELFSFNRTYRKRFLRQTTSFPEFSTESISGFSLLFLFFLCSRLAGKSRHPDAPRSLLSPSGTWDLPGTRSLTNSTHCFLPFRHQLNLFDVAQPLKLPTHKRLSRPQPVSIQTYYSPLLLQFPHPARFSFSSLNKRCATLPSH